MTPNDGVPRQPYSATSSDRASRYELIAQLDSGGMAEVHLALTRRFAGVKKLVVTKRLRPEFACDEEWIEMFLQEARLAARFRHPNVVQTYEVGEDDGTWFIAMEFLEGQSLSRLRRKAAAQGGIPLPIHLEILSEALRGLDYAHELADYDQTGLEIVHRDMNPQNIFVCYDGDVKILDFGIAKAASSVIETRAGWLKGKISYMAPEQVCGRPVDRRADLFSVGAMVWEAATSRRLWAGAEEVTILRRIVDNDFPWLSPEPGVPRQVAAIYERALARDPDDRFATAAEMQEAIDEYLGQLGARPSRADVARLVTGLFSEHRERLQRVIAAALARSTPGQAIVVRSHPAMTLAAVAPRRPPRKRWKAAALGGAILLAGGAWKWMSLDPRAPPASTGPRPPESVSFAPKPEPVGHISPPNRPAVPSADPNAAHQAGFKIAAPVGSVAESALIFDAARAPTADRVAGRPDTNWLDPGVDVLRKKSHRRPLDARDPWSR